MKFYTNELARIGCCGSAKKSACWVDISAAICATPSDYNANHKYDEHSTCATIAASNGLTSTTKQCTDIKPVHGNTHTLKQLTSYMATKFGCCGSSKKSACWEDISASGKLELSFCTYILK